MKRNNLNKWRSLLIPVVVGVGLLALATVGLVSVSLAATSSPAAEHPMAPMAPLGKENIGDYVWYDANVDGQHVGQPGELEYTGGIDNVLVNLYQDLNLNGQIDAGEFVTSTLTGDNPNTINITETGWYNFAVTGGNQYIVQIDPSNFAPTGTLYGYVHTSAGTYGPNPMVVPLLPGQSRYDVDFGFATSGIEVTKELLYYPDRYVVVSDTISYAITIHNTGDVTVSTVPLWDYYNPACLQFLGAQPPPTSHNPSLGVLHWANLGPLPPHQQVVVIVSLHAQKTNEMYWKEGSWPDYAPKGMPDFDQKQDQWDNPPGSGQKWYYCGPVASANSLWWFDSKFEPNPVPPPTINDGYPLVPPYGAWDDHDPQNVQPLVNVLAGLMGTAPGVGTNVNALAAGIAQHITNTVGPGQYTVTVMQKPPFEWVEEEVRRSEDVILLLGFYQEIPGQPPSSAERVGGHYVTVAGINSLTPTIAFSDPYTDRAEVGWPGRVLPNPHLPLHPSPGPISDTVHNNAKYASHDVYKYEATQTPGGTWGPQGYVPYNPYLGCPQIADFQGQNGGGQTCDPLGGYLWTEVEYAVAVSPITKTVLCDPTNNIAVVSGAVDELRNELPETQTEHETHVVNPKIDLVKTVQGVPDGGVKYATVGQPITYTYVVTNTGDTYLAPIVITDDNGTPGVPGDDFTVCTIPGPLAPGASANCTYNTTATTDRRNIGTATGTPSDAAGTPLPGVPQVQDSDDALVDVVNPQIDVAKTPDLQYVFSGGTVTFTVAVTNTGDVTLTNFTVTDPQAPNCVQAIPLLAPGATTSYLCTKTNVTLDFTNVITVTGTPVDDQGNPLPPDIPRPSDTDDALVDVVNPQIDVAKTPDLQYVFSGGTVTFTVAVTNTGDVTLTNFTVTDPQAPNCVQAIPLLAPGATTSYLCTRTNVTVEFTNVITVTGTPVDDQGNPLPPDIPRPSDTDDAQVRLLGSIGDFVWWDINGDGQQQPGEPGIPGVDVVLSDGLVLTTTTDANGIYTFTNLPADTYTITIPAYEFQPGGTLYPWYASPQNVGPDETDSDGHPVTHDVTVTLTAGQIITTTDFGFDITSTYVITKVLNTPEPVYIGDPLSFTLRITNTGATTITVLPLRDVYSTTYMTYGYLGQYSNPPSDDNVDDGQIDWTDLTASFGTDLGLGAGFSVIVTFTAKADTTALFPDGRITNTVTAYNVRADPDGPGPLPEETLPTQQADGKVRIEQPTGLALTGFDATAQPEGVLVTWGTASEQRVLGFNVLRARVLAGTGQFVKVNREFIFAENAGANLGASYAYLDKGLPAGTYAYKLEVVRLDGSIVQYGLGVVTVRGKGR